MTETFQSNLKTLQELILDEQKLVTYISLSKELCVHVNEAKLLLSKAVEEIKLKQPDVKLTVNYIISGLSNNNNAHTLVCPESELSNHEKGFKILFFRHIYSVIKGDSVVDNAAFIAVNKLEDIALCAGLIKNSSCFKLSTDEIGNLKTISQEPIANVSNKPLQNENKQKSASKTSMEVVKNGIKITETKSEPIIKQEIVKKEEPKSMNKKNNNKPTKGIAGFFAKANNPNTMVSNGNKEKSNNVIKVENCQKEEKIIKKKTPIKEEKMDIDDEPVEPIKTESKTVKDKPKNNSLSQIKKNAKVDKKRKRVLHVSDSESDDDANDPFTDEPINNESDDEIPPTPTVNTVKITSGIVNPKKRRKIVDKTYTDEDGYILTKKEEVYESCSDNEPDVNTKENVIQVKAVKKEISPKEKNSKRKVASPQKGKQQSIMSFFKKK